MKQNECDTKRETFPTYEPQGWEHEQRWSVQNWLEHSLERRLADTSYGVKDGAQPRPEVWDDPLVNGVIKMDIAIFLIGERHSIEHTAAMVGIAPDERSRAFLATQVLDEARHFEAFASRMAVLGISPQERNELMARYEVPEMRKLFDLTKEQIDKKSFVGAVIAQNLILEGMAFPIYRYESKYWSWFDPGLTQIIRGAFADEVSHTGYGEAYLRAHVAGDVRVRNEVTSLVRRFYGLMAELFEAHIKRYVSFYQNAANEHMDHLGDILIFPEKRMADISEEEQIRLLMSEIGKEYETRARAIGIAN